METVRLILQIIGAITVLTIPVVMVSTFIVGRMLEKDGDPFSEDGRWPEPECDRRYDPNNHMKGN